MSFIDRLKTARYTSPSGQSILFDYIELERAGAKKGSIQELPFQDGGVLQQLGNKIIQYPITAYFYGENYDIAADRMFKVLLESGIGILDHPRWGEIKVQLLSTFKQSEQFIENVRVSIFNIIFFEYKEQESPISQEEQRGNFLKKLDAFKEVVTLDFLRNFKVQNFIEKSVAVSEFNSLLDSLESGLDAIVQTKEEVKNQYDLILRNIDRVNGLIDDTETTITNIVSLNFLGVEANDNITHIVGSYKDLLTNYKEVHLTATNRANLNTVYQLQVFGICAVAAIANSVVEYDFANKSEAINILNILKDNFDEFIEYLDQFQEQFEDNLVENDYVITNDTYSLLNDLVYIAYSYILNQLYDLKTEQVIVLDKEVTPLVLCYELYGTIEKLDDLIADNNLSKYELYLLPIGKEIVIYV